jgi:pimeloyl-ACP methyl ester carboxylesterase
MEIVSLDILAIRDVGPVLCFFGKTVMKRLFIQILTTALAVICVASVALTVEQRAHRYALPPMPEAKKTGFAPVNGISMYYAIYGSGDPVLLIHGGLSSSDYWVHQVLALAKTHKVIVADSRGHGRSTRTPEPMSYDLMAADYVALLDYLGIERTALVGWSDGGIIGLDIAMTHPERLTKLFAHAANVTVEGLKPETPIIATPSSAVTPTPISYEPSSVDLSEKAAFAADIHRMWYSEPNWTSAQLEQINVPTAIVIGDRDEAIRFDHTEYMASVIPGAKLIVLKDAGHLALLQHPEAYSKAILDFLSER